SDLALDVAEDDEQAVLGVELRELALDRGLQARALGHGLGTGDAGLQRDHGAVVTGVVGLGSLLDRDAAVEVAAAQILDAVLAGVGGDAVQPRIEAAL